MTAEVVGVDFYTLRDPEAFDRAVRLLVARMRHGQDEGVRSFRFFGSGPRDRRLVAIYTGPEAWIRHQEQLMSWPEMQGLRAAARLAWKDLYGPLTPQMRDWIERAGLGPRLRHRGVMFAGFHPVS